jgi:adenine phosphoribosyltransferase
MEPVRASSSLTPQARELIAARIRTIPDFPEPGILFRDITPLLGDAATLRATIDALAEPFRDARIDQVVGIESRGFLFGMPVAYLLGSGFVPVRKRGKLPHTTVTEEYALEYGTNAVEIHQDAMRPGQRVLIVDDLLATGGTAAAAVALVRRLGAEVVALSFVIELVDLRGRARLENDRVFSLIGF